MKRVMIFGYGFAGRAIGRQMLARGWQVSSTGSAGDFAFNDSNMVALRLAQADVVISTVPPVDGACPVLSHYGDGLAGKWLVYLSSTGVYGDARGGWVDETAPVGGGRRSARVMADAAWLARGARVFRLPGIYGPGRSAFDRLRDGRAHRIALPDQVFSRVHVEDIAGGVLAAIDGDAPAGAYNLADDLPTSQNTVIEAAARLMGIAPPPLMALDDPGLPPASRAFYAENRRVANGRAKRVLGWRLLYPTYAEGLRAIWRGENA
ncbi:SDR family NAD(P)-dependent oxidoreductase [Novosphingobium sp. FSY-8]|uniref:SDR family NAD(P)-dependent oxidoreductase n=1 Tax=Novosphingobium ovatum TaxID=1908523 RepID=A0ABW9XEK5_9SPHN|nr:SDR family NAD(P)-dependent oxidoreductase [Novosphingobium ovatum]NBC36949.1 SDR family NAD(P)-dependent oxidoreductase [Novosphingobium ovatum]